MPGTSALVRVDYETSDGEAIADYFAKAYGAGVKMRGWRPGHRLHHERLAFAGISLDDVSVDSGLDFDVDPLGVAEVYMGRSGAFERDSGGTVETIGPGELALVADPDRPYSVRQTPSSFDSITVPLDLLARAAGLPPADAPPIHFETLRRVDEAFDTRWQLLMQYLRDSMERTPEVFDEPLVVDAIEGLLASTVLGAFPSSYTRAPARTDRADGTPDLLRRAIAHIEANAELGMTVGEIAASCGVTPRSLQYAFRRHLDTTPMAYLRRVRLDAAHRALRDGDPSRGATVAGIAAQWGFFNAGSFAALYRTTYGRPPHTTLRRT